MNKLEISKNRRTPIVLDCTTASIKIGDVYFDISVTNENHLRIRKYDDSKNKQDDSISIKPIVSNTIEIF